MKKRLSVFYGLITNKTIKNLIKTSIHNIKKKKTLFPNIFITLLENRVESILYRAHFFKSIRQSRLAIKHGHILVNNIKIKSNKYLINEGDVISISKEIHNVIKNNLYDSKFLILPPNYFKVNYRTFQIIILENNVNNYLPVLFPFHLELNNLLNYK
jgi:small subunit ribosomal protein S4